jgi:ArsR family transcriptional regulator, arsenate/arsenite/antimonite-responsive transcriptional repressor
MKESETVAALSALAHETRLRVFRTLVGAGPGGLSAGSLSARLALAAPNLSFHLSHLCHAGLIGPRRQGRSVIYTANFETMNRLVGYLTDHCCGGRPELCVRQIRRATLGRMAGRQTVPRWRKRGGS